MDDDEQHWHLVERLKHLFTEYQDAEDEAEAGLVATDIADLVPTILHYLAE